MYLILLSILIPILAGVYLLVRKEYTNRKHLLAVSGAGFVLTGISVICAIITAKGESFTLFYLTRTLPIMFAIDEMSILFSLVTLIIYICAGFFSFEYMKHETKEKRYYGFYLIVFGVLNALCFAGNLVTFYLFFEMMTLSSMPLVLHSGSHESIMAGLKYMFYSLCGAYMSLFGIYFIYQYSDTLKFTVGGVLNENAASHVGILLIAALVMIVGFGVKAGMFPMHAWLPAAHPVAPAPASALLSGILTGSCRSTV